MRHGFTSHGFFLGVRCGVPPRQIQTDNDASGNPQRVAGCLQDVPYDIAYRRCKCTVLQYAKKTRPSALCVGAVPKGGPPRINDDTHNRYMRHGFANCDRRSANGVFSEQYFTGFPQRDASHRCPFWQPPCTSRWSVPGGPKRLSGCPLRSSPMDCGC